MPLALGTHRVQIVAGLQDGEQMTHTLWVSRGGIPDPSARNIDPAHLATTVRDAWANTWKVTQGGAVPLSFLNASTRYQKVVAYEMDDQTGRANEVAEAAFDATVVGTGATHLPTEVAVAVTLLTGSAGRTRKGRLYLGGFATTALTSANGHVATAATASLAATMKAFLNAVKAVQIPGGTEVAYVPCVHSITTGTQRAITGVQVGDIFDVQRRRRNKITEVRAGATL